MAPEDYQIIVVNDGSTDRSLEVAQEFATGRSNVTIIDQQNTGLGGARNAGTAAASGTFVMYVDSDDYLAADALAALVDIGVRLDLQVVAFDSNWVSDDDDLFQSRRPIAPGFEPEVLTGMEYMTTTRRYSSEAWAYLYRRDYLHDLGVSFPVRRYVEDILFTAEVLAAADRLAHVPVDVYRYVQRGDSIMNASGRAHARKLAEDLQHVVVGFSGLIDRWADDPAATPAFLERVRARQSAYVFFSIARFVRSDAPVGRILEATDEFRHVDAYPIRVPPKPGWKHRLLATMFDHRATLWLFTHATRGATTVMGIVASLR
jgi:glycosyltransferase involved in cell wall biosynthesis